MSFGEDVYVIKLFLMGVVESTRPSGKQFGPGVLATLASKLESILPVSLD